jgi:aminoglycoside phosphotransferase family enzyme/predicted kinase
MDDRYQRIVAALRGPDAYVHESVTLLGPIDVVETHVSHLFMTADFVYKIKKPVDLGFVDLSTLELRRSNCEAELRLNRRLSPDVYLAVLPVVQRDGAITLGGDGNVIEYAVKMRRLPHDRMLDALLATDDVTVADIERIADYLATFHQSAETSPEITRRGGFDTLAVLVSDNFPQTERFVGKLVTRSTIELIAAYSRAFLRQREATFRAREQSGRIRDGHGDLHAAHVCLQEAISVIDCLEFSPDYRYGDTALDLAFLAMDLDHFGREDLGLAMVERYMQSARDDGVREVLTFFKCYRAMVRAKIAAIRFETATADDEKGRAVAEREASEYFDLATAYALSALPGHALFVVMGLPGAGKSTLAKALTGSSTVVSSDFARKRQAGLAPDQHNYVPYGTGMYSATADEQAYEAIIERALRELQATAHGYQVVDASFRNPVYRERIVQEASAAGVDVWFIEATASPEVVRKRIAARMARGDDVSDATIAVYERARAEWVPISEVTDSRHFAVDTDRPVEEAVRQVFDAVLSDALHRGPADGWATWSHRATASARRHDA